jgi:glycosyltransferase involved in cell wall biosynthesis
VRVAIDGSFLSLPPSGIGTYLRHLTAALHDSASDLDLRLIEPYWDASTSTISSFPTSIVNRLRADRRLRRALWDLGGVSRHAARFNPDLLHIPHFAAPVRPRGPLIVTIHDVIPLVVPAYQASRAMRLNLTVMRRTVRAARLILTPSKAAAADITRVLDIPRDRIRVTPEAAGSEFQPSTDLAHDRAVAQRLGITSRYIFNVGGFETRKNLPVLLEAFARLLPRIDQSIQLVIAGTPHSANPAVFPPLQPTIERLGLSDAIVLPGRISDDDKRALYRGAALYATPSLYEGFGLTALEAMACGIPTIAANRTSLPEVVGDGGLLVEPDAESFATAMATILSDAELATRFKERGLARAATFSWRRTAELTLDAYHEVIDSTATPSRLRKR